MQLNTRLKKPHQHIHRGAAYATMNFLGTPSTAFGGTVPG